MPSSACWGPRGDLPSFPTRRSSDLYRQRTALPAGALTGVPLSLGRTRDHGYADRKSTRLNSSHLGISYAVFCLLGAPRRSTLFPYTTLFRSVPTANCFTGRGINWRTTIIGPNPRSWLCRSEEHTSELQSLRHLVCRLLLAGGPAEIYPLSLHDALPICTDSELLYRQVHYLAYHYHWAEPEIMAMPRIKRQKYIELLAGETERVNDY